MRTLTALLPLLLLSCNDSEEPEACANGTAQTWVITELTFARRAEGVVQGFDLDLHDSGSGDELGCGHADLITPDGESGIDNNISAVLPILEATEAVATESLIRQSIASGELLMLLTLDGLDSWQDDSCVNFSLRRGEGLPLVDSSGVVLDQQTFSHDPGIATASTDTVAVDGHIEASELSFNLPLDVLNAELDFRVTRGVFELQRRYDGAVTGVMGGVMPISQLIEILDRPDVNLQEFIPIVEAIADMRDEEGDCSGLSIGFDFVAVPAYVQEREE